MKHLEVYDLYLEGFAKIHTGMHIDRLYLDFHKLPNQTYLFVGDSGSGKSSVLKSIHPFAFNSSTGDETSNSDLIMSGRDGKKIITYILDNKEIVCKHLYIRKQDGGIQVKSYFAVNKDELNPSGLVSTFKELVYQYFYIDESFLTLFALGNSVRSMVDYTSGERKKLSVKIFTELNIYMTYYKNASGVVKELKTILTSVVDKLERYGQYDKKVIKKNIKELEGIITNTQGELDEILKQEGVVSANMSSILEDYNKYQEGQDSITSMLSQIEVLKRKRKTNKDYVVLENDKNGIKSNLIDTELRIKSLEDTITSELNFKEMKLKSKQQLEDSINRMEDNINQLELEKLLANVTGELSSLHEVDIDNGIDYKEKKEQLVRANIYLDELRSMSTDLVSEVEFQELIPEVLEQMMKNRHFDTELDLSYQAVMERITNLQVAHHISGEIKIPKIQYPECTTRECPYKKFYTDVSEMLRAKNDTSKHILRDEENRKHIIEQKIIIRRILKKLMDYLYTHKDVLKYLPKEIFDPDTFVLKFLDSVDREVYNRDLMGSTVTYFENATRKVELLRIKENTENQIKGINTTKELFHSLKGDLEQVNHILEETDLVIENHQRDLDFNKQKNVEYNESLISIDVEIGYAKELEELRGKIQEMQRNMASMESLKSEHDQLEERIRALKEMESSKRMDLQTYRRDLNTTKNTLDVIESLEKEKLELAERYSDAVMIKDAVSPSKGIPVEFIDDVIRNQMIDAINELMHVAYPDITLIKDRDKLIINEKEFTIPYKKNGVIIGDISEASDGERAMLSLAFSLVLIRLVSKVYNIMLLDEMDTSLDKYGRSKYIDIIEQYMGTIHANQVFLISHNSMFDMYQVNILQTVKGNGTPSEDSIVVNLYEQNYTPEKYMEVI